MNSEFSERLTHIEQILADAVPEQSTEKWKKISFNSLSDAIKQQHLAGLIDPCRMLLMLGGKRWRPLLLVLCAEMTIDKLKEQGKLSSGAAAIHLENAYKLTPLVEFVHTASLIHDDIEDSADMRRGKPAAHIRWGIDTALNAGSWFYFEAPSCIEELNIPENKKYRLCRLYMQEVRRLHLGQAMDIQWHRAADTIPSTEEYISMVRCKTGTLAALAAQIGVLVGGGTKTKAAEAGKTAADIGVGFQILDDVQNLTTGNPGKKRGDDIVEGKKSLPVLLYLNAHPDDRQRITSYMRTAKKEGPASPAVEECIAVLEKSKSISDASQQGRELIYDKSRELAALYSTKVQADTAQIVKLFESMLPAVK
jgi:octaprenyl-diphosphate synthase